jgi:hypothetical protein
MSVRVRSILLGTLSFLLLGMGGIAQTEQPT